MMNSVIYPAMLDKFSRAILMITGIGFLVSPWLAGWIYLQYGILPIWLIISIMLCGLLYRFFWNFFTKTAYEVDSSRITITLAGLRQRSINIKLIKHIEPIQIPWRWGIGIRYIPRNQTLIYTTALTNTYKITMQNGVNIIISPRGDFSL